MQMIEVPVSWGELIDKITILEIKAERMDDPAKVANVTRELWMLTNKLGGGASGEVLRLKAKLRSVNEELWDIEDDIRDCERGQDFGPRFIALARAVYMTNDQRAELKREINLVLSSELIEEKSYRPYA
jgi:hypothetical protein